MEEPRVGRLNSTNNQLADPELPNYDEAINDVVHNGIDDPAVDNPDAAMSDIDSDGMLFVGPPPAQPANDNDADELYTAAHDTCDTSLSERQG